MKAVRVRILEWGKNAFRDGRRRKNRFCSEKSRFNAGRRGESPEKTTGGGRKSAAEKANIRIAHLTT